MTRTRSFLYVGRGTSHLHDAARFTIAQRAELAVLDVDATTCCDRRSARDPSGVGQMAGRVATRVRALDAELVILDADLPQRTMAGTQRRLGRASCDLLLISGPITSGCVVAAIDPAASIDANAAILATALAHSYLHRCKLHIVHACPVGARAPCEQLAELAAPICGFDPARMHIVRGEPATSIGALVRSIAPDVVVLGPSKPRHVKLAGSVVEQVLHSSSALIVHPQASPTSTDSLASPQRTSQAVSGRRSHAAGGPPWSEGVRGPAWPMWRRWN